MKLFPSMNHPGVWITTIMASSILMITMGTRQSMGLYVGPLNTDTGLGIVSISLAMAIGQFVWGAIQPIAGAFADKFGPRPVLLSGLLILVLGSALTPFVSSQLGLIVTLGLLTAIGSGACSFSVLLSAVAQRMPATSRRYSLGHHQCRQLFWAICLCPHHWQTDSVGRLDEHHVGHGRCYLAGHSIAQPPHQ